MDVPALEALVARGEGAAELNRALVDRHAARDAPVMCALHRLAAQYWAADPDQAAFHRTHAYIYALEAGLWEEAEQLFAVLRAEGRI